MRRGGDDPVAQCGGGRRIRPPADRAPRDPPLHARRRAGVRPLPVAAGGRPLPVVGGAVLDRAGAGLRRMDGRRIIPTSRASGTSWRSRPARTPRMLIGDCAFQARASEPSIVDIGYTLSPSGQGQGYATEAVAELLRYLFEDRGKHKVTRGLRHAERRLVAAPRAPGLHARGRAARRVPRARRLEQRVPVRIARRRVARTVYSEGESIESDREHDMSRIVVISFDTEDQARQALATLRGVEKQGGIHFEDTAVVTHKSDGSFDVKNEASSATEAGAVVGGLIGGLRVLRLPGRRDRDRRGRRRGHRRGHGPGRSRRLRQGGRGEAARPASPRCSSRSRRRTRTWRSPRCASTTARCIQTSLDEETEEALKAALASPAT